MRDVEQMEIAFAQSDLEGLHVEPVAGENGHMVAPDDVGGGTAAAFAGSQ